jgi:hypothetical protein
MTFGTTLVGSKNKLSPCLIKYYGKKTYGELKIHLYAPYNPAINGSVQSYATVALYPDRVPRIH